MLFVDWNYEEKEKEEDDGDDDDDSDDDDDFANFASLWEVEGSQASRHFRPQ